MLYLGWEIRLASKWERFQVAGGKPRNAACVAGAIGWHVVKLGFPLRIKAAVKVSFVLTSSGVSDRRGSCLLTVSTRWIPGPWYTVRPV